MNIVLPPVPPPADGDAEPGRCVYCGERCSFDATSHDYCRLAEEAESRRANRMAHLRKPRLPREHGDER